MSTDRFLQFSRLYLLDSGAPISLMDWQREAAEAIFGRVGAAGRRVIREAGIFMPKKTGKSEFGGLIAAYMLLADPARPAVVLLLSNDREQSRHIFLRTKRSFERSPALAREVRILSDSIERRDNLGYLKIVSADQKSSGGERPSCLVCDESGYYDNWNLISENSPGPEILESLILYLGFRGPRVYDRAGCVLHDLVKRAEAGDPELYLIDSQEHPVAKPEFLDRMKRQLPASEYARVWENRWTDEGAFLPGEWIERAVDESLGGPHEPDEAALYLMGVDLGVRRDNSAVAVLEIGETVRVVALKVWRAGRDAEIQLREVEREIRELYYKYRPRIITYDPWQMLLLGQHLKDDGMPVNEYTLSQSSKNHLAQGLFALFRENRIAIPPGEELRTELAQLVLKENRIGGVYWDHVPGQHDDMTMAIGLAAAPALDPTAGPEPEGWVGEENCFTNRMFA